MLDHHEEEALAEIEAHLHADDPALSEALDAGVAAVPAPLHPVARCFMVVVVVLASITISTLWFGPNAGGLAAVLGLSYAFLYSWASLRACPGLRANR